MKKLLPVLLGLLGLTFAVSGHAAQATGTFNVNINLTSACIYTKTADVQFDYTAFQTTAATATSGGFTVQCNTGLAYSMALDGATPGSYVDQALNLAYTLALSAANGVGDGTAQPYTVTGSMAANQMGNCATTAVCANAASTNKTRTLTITY